MRHAGDFRQAVTSLIRCGGDADSTAAIVGGIMGSGVGKPGIPREWLGRLVGMAANGRLDGAARGRSASADQETVAAAAAGGSGDCREERVLPGCGSPRTVFAGCCRRTHESIRWGGGVHRTARWPSAGCRGSWAGRPCHENGAGAEADAIPPFTLLHAFAQGRFGEPPRWPARSRPAGRKSVRGRW